MHNLSKLATALLIGTMLSASALAAGNAFVTVNGVAVSQNMANVFIAEQKAQGAPDTPELKNAVREELIRRELLLQEAKKAGLDKKTRHRRASRSGTPGVLCPRLRPGIRQEEPDQPTSSSKRNTRRSRPSSAIPSTRRATSWSRMKPTPRRSSTNLKKGAKFEELAKQSIDPGLQGQRRQPRLGERRQLCQTLQRCANRIDQRANTPKTPVKTDFGYHVIMLEDTPSADCSGLRGNQTAPAAASARTADQPRWSTRCAPRPRSSKLRLIKRKRRAGLKAPGFR